jgi:hypothetical protein
LKNWHNSDKLYGGFHIWGHPNSWMVYDAKSFCVILHVKRMIWGIAMIGNLHMV